MEKTLSRFPVNKYMGRISDIEKRTMEKIDLLPPSEDNPRNSEGAMLELKNGEILFVYTHFYGGKGDASAAYLGARYSSNGGKLWTDSDDVIIGNEGKENVMSVSLLRLKTGILVLGYMIKNSLSDCKYHIRKSCDEGKTWGKKTCVTNGDFNGGAYFVVNNDRIIQTSSGRLLIPAARHPNKERQFRPGEVMVFCSDDEGDTWKHSKSVLYPPDTKDPYGLQEPGVVEIEKNRILMWMRTSYGCQYYSVSEDDGETWTHPVPSPLISPLSPASIKKIPGSGSLLVVYNDHSGIKSSSKGVPYEGRTPLVIRISKDTGKNWTEPFIVEDDPKGRFCYTSILFIDNKVILSYSADSSERAWGLMRVTILNRKEIYEN
jgi:sialidase-1